MTRCNPSKRGVKKKGVVAWKSISTLLAPEEIAHAAIDAGADVVVGHGPHQPLAIEIYRGRPIFYGLGNFAFKTRHWGSNKGCIDAGVRGNDAWIGMLVDLTILNGKVKKVAFKIARHNEKFQTLIRNADDEPELVERIAKFSSVYDTRLTRSTEEVVVVHNDE
jgi:hypothetical protein